MSTGARPSSFDRFERIVGGTARAVRAFALVAAGAAAVVVAFLFRNGTPDEADGWALVAISAALAAWPPAVLFLLSAALKALAGLPARLRGTPGEAGARADELLRIAEQARGVRGVRLTRLPLLVWRFARVTGSSRELLTPHAAVLPLASVPFLLLSAAAATAVLPEVIAALVLAVLLAAGV